jgi:four helix bundle protein
VEVAKAEIDQLDACGRKVHLGGPYPAFAGFFECLTYGIYSAPLVSMRKLPELLGRVYRFSLASLGFYRTLPKSPEAQVPGVQFYKAATSSWSNYRASQRGRSRQELIAKLGSVAEESDEAVGWLEFMRDGQIASDSALLEEAKELSAIFTASLTSARQNSERGNGKRRG